MTAELLFVLRKMLQLLAVKRSTARNRNKVCRIVLPVDELLIDRVVEQTSVFLKTMGLF